MWLRGETAKPSAPRPKTIVLVFARGRQTGDKSMGERYITYINVKFGFLLKEYLQGKEPRDEERRMREHVRCQAHFWGISYVKASRLCHHVTSNTDVNICTCHANAEEMFWQKQRKGYIQVCSSIYQICWFVWLACRGKKEDLHILSGAEIFLLAVENVPWWWSKVSYIANSCNVQKIPAWRNRDR